MKSKSRIGSVVDAGSADEASEVKYFLSAEGMSFKVLQSGGETMTERVTEPNSAFSEAGDEEAPF